VNWEVFEEKTGITHHLDIKPLKQEVVAMGTTGHWRSGTGNTTSFKGFLAGDWDRWIIEIFGITILKEAKKIVKGLIKE